MAGRPYFIGVSIAPYRGPGSYDLGPLPPPQPLSDPSTPDALTALGVPNLLNFLPKRGESFTPDRTFGRASMTVAPGERSGWFVIAMSTFDQGTRQTLYITSRFQCGAAFTP